MCLSDCVPVKAQALPWVAHQGLDLGSFLCSVACLISSHLIMEKPSQIIICNGYSSATVANEGSFESP